MFSTLEPGCPECWFEFLCPRLPTLFLGSRSKSVGPGLFIQHGHGTSVTAETIGENCWINQLVTVGYSNEVDCPTIGNNVRI